MNQPASAAVRQKEKSSVPLNNKREDQSIKRLALDLKNSFQHNCSVKRTNKYQTSCSGYLNEQMLQRQFRSEKGTNRVTKGDQAKSILLRRRSSQSHTFDNNQSAALKPFQTLNSQLFE